MQETKISAIGKSDLAMMYFPGSMPEAANRRLRRAICRNKDWLLAMRRAGYDIRANTYSPREVAIIYEFYGEP